MTCKIAEFSDTLELSVSKSPFLPNVFTVSGLIDCFTIHLQSLPTTKPENTKRWEPLDLAKLYVVQQYWKGSPWISSTRLNLMKICSRINFDFNSRGPLDSISRKIFKWTLSQIESDNVLWDRNGTGIMTKWLQNLLKSQLTSPGHLVSLFEDGIVMSRLINILIIQSFQLNHTEKLSILAIVNLALLTRDVINWISQEDTEMDSFENWKTFLNKRLLQSAGENSDLVSDVVQHQLPSLLKIVIPQEETILRLLDQKPQDSLSSDSFVKIAVLLRVVKLDIARVGNSADRTQTVFKLRVFTKEKFVGWSTLLRKTPFSTIPNASGGMSCMNLTGAFLLYDSDVNFWISRISI
ncbi:hypothetical protein HK096_008341 [Nowakowskiella sp. JEL0078]|nr:hypothetical protein HK096_008341 [Nowakowskiella sp. JEL0078]